MMYMSPTASRFSTSLRPRTAAETQMIRNMTLKAEYGFPLCQFLLVQQ